MTATTQSQDNSNQQSGLSGINPVAGMIGTNSLFQPIVNTANANLLASMPSLDTYNQLLRSNAVNAPIVGASQMAQPGYSSGMDQAAVAGLGALTGYNPLQGFRGMSTSPAALAPVVQQLQNQADISRQQNVQRGQAAFGLGGASQDYLNSLAKELAMSPTSGMLPTPQNIAQLGQYYQNTAAQGQQYANQAAPEALAANAGSPLVTAGIRQNLGNAYANTYAPNSYTPNAVQSIYNAVTGNNPNLYQNYPNKEGYLSAVSDPGIETKAANAASLKQLNETLQASNTDVAQMLPNVEQNLGNLNKIVTDPTITKNLNSYVKSQNPNAKDFVQSSLFTDLMGKVGITGDPAMIQATQAAVLNNPKIMGNLSSAIQSGSINTGLLTQMVQQAVNGVKSNYRVNSIAADLSNQLTGDSLHNVNPTKIMTDVQNNKYLSPNAALSKLPYVDKTGQYTDAQGNLMTPVTDANGKTAYKPQVGTTVNNAQAFNMMYKDNLAKNPDDKVQAYIDTNKMMDATRGVQ
jgi:hypothetical protein